MWVCGCRGGGKDGLLDLLQAQGGGTLLINDAHQVGDEEEEEEVGVGGAAIPIPRTSKHRSALPHFLRSCPLH